MVLNRTRRAFGRLYKGYRVFRFIIKAGVVTALGGYIGWKGLPADKLTTTKPLKTPGYVATETGMYHNKPIWGLKSVDDCANIDSMLDDKAGVPVRLKVWGWRIPYTPLHKVVTQVNYLNPWEMMGGNYKQVSLKTPVEMTGGLENLFIGYQGKHGVGIIPLYTDDSSIGGYTLFAKPGSKLGPHVDPVTQMITDSVLNVGAPKK